MSVIVICVQCFELSANSRGSQQILFSVLFFITIIFRKQRRTLWHAAWRQSPTTGRSGAACPKPSPTGASRRGKFCVWPPPPWPYPPSGLPLLLSRHLGEFGRKSCAWRLLASAVAFQGTLTGCGRDLHCCCFWLPLLRGSAYLVTVPVAQLLPLCGLEGGQDRGLASSILTVPPPPHPPFSP